MITQIKLLKDIFVDRKVFLSRTYKLILIKKGLVVIFYRFVNISHV